MRNARFQARLIPAHAGKTPKSLSRMPTKGAHPRSRGENDVIAPVIAPVMGSSPLTRGKRANSHDDQADRGLIPAHAGKTGIRLDRRHGARAHPRSRGENRPGVVQGLEGEGSSPLTRGKPASGPAFGQRPGLIPAHAGKTVGFTNDGSYDGAHPRSRGENALRTSERSFIWGSSPLTRGTPPRPRPSSPGWGAHPRSRGENREVVTQATEVPGSSPLTRGKRLRAGDRGQRSGLIPAHAGKTSSPTQTLCLATAHPRSRGENRKDGRCPGGAGGSSPLTRGKPEAGRPGREQGGLIPAHAGKTRAWSWCRWSPAAHPRSRGENVAPRAGVLGVEGSSPLTRGKPNSRSAMTARSRLIPAHAGKTRDEGAATASPRAHPRSRGENQRIKSVAASVTGSSPLTRGKRRSTVERERLRGLIPAHAGKTDNEGDTLDELRAHPRSRGENPCRKQSGQ